MEKIGSSFEEFNVNQRSISASEEGQKMLPLRAERRHKMLTAERDRIAKALNEMLAAPVGEHELSIFGDKFEGVYRRYMYLESVIPKLSIFR